MKHTLYGKCQNTFIPKREAPTGIGESAGTNAAVLAISADVARLRDRSEQETRDTEMTLDILTRELNEYQELQKQIDAERALVKEKITEARETTNAATRRELRQQLRQLNDAAVTLQEIIRDTSERWGDTALYLKFGMPISNTESGEIA